MVKRQVSSNTNVKSPLRFWLMAGASSVALAAVVVGVSTRTVHADARLPRPAAAALPAASVAGATPALLTPDEPVATERADLLRGHASWYGGVFNGRRTASGERFDMYAMTACHPPCPSARWFAWSTSRTAVGRGAHHRPGLPLQGAIIDLSFAAAQKLAMTKAGLAVVRVEVLSLGESHHEK